jgi:hypothetical protein
LVSNEAKVFLLRRRKLAPKLRVLGLEFFFSLIH